MLFKSGKNHENSMEVMEFFFSEAVRTLYKQSKFRKQAGTCLWKKLVQAQSMHAFCLFIKILLGVCLRKRLDQAPPGLK